MMAYYFNDLSPFIFQFGNEFGLRWYGMAYLAAFLIGWWLYRLLAKRGYSDLQPQQVGDFIFAAAVFGVLIGGRIGYVLFYEPGMLAQDPLALLKVWEGGMSSHGGILGLIIFTLVYSKWKKISWVNLGDNLVVVSPVGLFFGRCANFINGELYGRVSQVPWAVYFPRELPSVTEAKMEILRSNPETRAEVIDYLQPRHPSQLYEAFAEGLLLFAILWLLRTRCRLPDGALTGWFFILYALGRISVEFFREPDASLILGMSRGQFYSLFMILIGLVFLWYAHRTGRVRQPQPARESS